MSTVSPTRLSMYDFLSEDMQPIVSLLADAAQLSLPQARLGLSASLQAIVTALLAYHDRHHAAAVHKKLLTRSAVKELRQYNAMNFVTIGVSLYHRNDVADTLFGDSPKVMQACDHIATQIKASRPQVKTLLTSLCVLALRELAILADYSQLDTVKLGEWFELQPQFLQVAVFDPFWYELSQFWPTQTAPNTEGQPATATPNYLEAIAQTTESVQQHPHDDLLAFAPMANIQLPQQRWLLQLAKVADICLRRDRLRIASEPATAPIAPLLSLGLGLLNVNSQDTPTTTSEPPIKYDTPTPLWKSPVILIIILVIGGLGALAMLKYQQQQSDGRLSAADAVYEHDHPKERAQPDVALVKTDDNENVTIPDIAN